MKSKALLPGKWVNNKGVKIYYEVEGEGFPIIMVHGYIASILHSKQQIAQLSKYYKCIALDRRGAGNSDAPKVEKYTRADHVSDIRCILEQERIDKAVLTGVSMGAAIILGYYLEYPEQVAGLVSMGGVANPAVSSHMPTGAVIEMAKSPEIRLESMDRTVFSERQKKEQLSGVLELKLDALRYTPHGISATIIGERAPEFGIVNERLAEVKVPTIIIVGSVDMVTPPIVSKVMYDHIAKSRMYVLDGAGHWPNTELPDECNRIIKAFVDDNVIGGKPLERGVEFVFRDKDLE